MQFIYCGPTSCSCYTRTPILLTLTGRLKRHILSKLLFVSSYSLVCFHIHSTVIEMEEYVTKTIGLGVISWTIAFLIARRIFSNHSFEFSRRIVSTIHATLAVTLASLSVQDWKCPLWLQHLPIRSEQMQTLAVTLSYFIYDSGRRLFGRRVSLDNTIHHLVSIVGITAGLYYQKCGSESMAALWVTEMSSPFFHLREFLKELGYRDTALNLAADISFAAIFTLARMVAGPFITYVTLSADNPPLIKAMGLGLQLVSAFWFFKIVRMVKYRLRKWTALEFGYTPTNWSKTTSYGFQYCS